MVNFYIAATPIGNYKDITLRVCEILKSVSFIVCENESEYRRLFVYLGIDVKDFVVCSKKNEIEAIEITLRALKSGKTGALISDCGTPLFEDPGFDLINSVRKSGFKITSLPGANSLVTALSLSPFRIRDFYFAGFLPIKEEFRVKVFLELMKRKEAVAFMETPYRLKEVINLLKKYLKNRKIFIPYNLTMDDETLIYGTPFEVEKIIEDKKITKGEFLIIIEGI